MISPYAELRFDLMGICYLSKEQADNVINFLKECDILDYDILKEAYTDDDD
jgi:hypothetical protein